MKTIFVLLLIIFSSLCLSQENILNTSLRTKNIVYENNGSFTIFGINYSTKELPQLDKIFFEADKQFKTLLKNDEYVKETIKLGETDKQIFMGSLFSSDEIYYVNIIVLNAKTKKVMGNIFRIYDRNYEKNTTPLSNIINKDRNAYYEKIKSINFKFKK